MSLRRGIVLVEAFACIAVSLYAFQRGSQTHENPSAALIPLIVGIRMLMKNANESYHSTAALLAGTLAAGAACFAALSSRDNLPQMSVVCIILLYTYLYMPKMVSKPQRY